MQYLDYQEYLKIGGICDATAFNRYIDRACGIIDNATHNRLREMREIPNGVKSCIRDLVEYLARNSQENTVVSRSQSAGGVSESESYSVKGNEEIRLEIENIIFDYLMGITDDYFTPLLYRGCSR